MTTCIYGSDSFKEGAVICVNGRGLRCVSGEWCETGQPCGDADSVDDRPKNSASQDPPLPDGSKAKAKAAKR